VSGLSWLRYSDDFTTDRSWDGVSYEARWHYLALVEECSQARRWDGALPVTRAVRCSDTQDPEKCIDELIRAGRLNREADTVYVVAIDDHVPPEGQREENLLPRKRSNTRDYRKRQCEAGNHTRHCPAATCPTKNRVTGDGQSPAGWVTGHPGTGRDGQLEAKPTTEISVPANSSDQAEHAWEKDRLWTGPAADAAWDK